MARIRPEDSGGGESVSELEKFGRSNLNKSLFFLPFSLYSFSAPELLNAQPDSSSASADPEGTSSDELAQYRRRPR